MISDLIWEKIKPLNEIENTMKEAYELIGKHDNRTELNRILAQMGIKVKNYWLPYFNNEQNSYLTQSITTDIVGLDKAHVSIRPHPRYQQYSLHRHDFYELMYVAKGSCDHVVEEHRFTLSEGEFCLVPPYVRHMVGVFSDNSLVYNFLFTKELQKVLISLIHDESFLSSQSSQYDCVRFCLKEHGYVHFLAEMLIKQRVFELSDDDFNKANITCLLLHLFTMHSKNAHFYFSEYIQNSRVSEIIFYMQTNYRNVTLDSLATHFHYTTSYIGSLLKANTGITFTSLRSRIRIVQSCYYLNNSSDTISEIAESVGYSNLSHFTRVFKQQIRVTPSDFRKKSKSSTLLII